MKTDRDEMMAGLMAPQKHLPCKFFYNEKGSKLFEQITRLEEYFQSRTEKSILRSYARKLIRGADGATLVEFGSGDCSKISILFDALPKAALEKSTYIPIDVSLSAIEASKKKLQQRFGVIKIREIVADFMKPLHMVSNHDKRIFCFFGSTIGNLDRHDAARFIARLGKLMKTGERLLLGLDMVKDTAIMERAYNDKKEVTATFNRNILQVANKILGTDFDPVYFQHDAFFDEQKQRIEMHLVATKNMTITSPYFQREVKILKGQNIHTENAYKFTNHHINEFAIIGGFSVRAVYNDDNHWFALVDYAK